MNVTLKKMNFKAGQEILVINTPPTCLPLIASWQLDSPGLAQGSLEDLTAIPLDHFDFILAFVYSDDQVQTVVDNLKSILKPATTLWFAYPKKSSKAYKATINRDTGWLSLGALNYEPVRQIAIDDDFSALRFKPVDEIKTLTRSAKMTLSQAAKERLKG